MKLLKILPLLLLVCCTPKSKPDDVQTLLEAGKWIDLSYSFSDKTLYWPSVTKTFTLDTVFVGETPGGFFYSSYSFSAPEHGGTHLDAPVHFAKGKLAVDEISLEQLSGNAVIIDVSAAVGTNNDYLISVKDVTDWENKHGKIPVGSIVLFRTGYGKFYPDAASYLGTTEKGADGVAKLHFPGIDPALAEWLVKNRTIKAVGLDTASVDYGQSKDFKTHQILYAANICGFENVANLEKLPPTGVYVIALPMKIAGGSGAPLRIIARIKS